MELLLLTACLLGIQFLIQAPDTSRAKLELRKQTTKLVREYRAGKKEAFDELVHLYQNKIYTLTLNYVKQTEEAKDLTQDIFVTVFRALPTLKDDTKFSSWLYQIAVNHCRNRYKRLQRRGFFNSYSLDDPESPLQLQAGDQPDDLAERKNIMKVILETMDTMTDTEKEILHLRDVQDFSYEEISGILEIPLGTLKSKLNRARLSLKNKLKFIL